ncbi:DUF4105 domain-containing protein [Thioclava sp. BHET1]|nr:DUF4105 domain-containing protein [Thioclava sp. BHET1]
MRHFSKISFHVIFALLLLAGGAWSATALWLNTAGGMRFLGLALLALGMVAIAVARTRRRRLGWVTLAIAGVAVAGWYQTITPRADRIWADDVAHGLHAQVDGNMVTLANLRDFDWHTKDRATQRWITERYDLDQLSSVEMLTSVWDNPNIAHLLVSFGFTTGEHVVFSVEIRREKGEKLSEIGGFFRQFELVLIGATERDIVRLRTDYRAEQVRMYPVTLNPEQRRTMFMSYVTLAQRLEARPEFYNTISANCTTVVYGLARGLKSDLPINASLILSGRLPEYLDGLGVLGGTGPLPARRAAALLPAHAQSAHPGLSYSQAIRVR